ncbi:hypothetical protein V2J09_016806 [Rumex salicifolius]
MAPSHIFPSSLFLIIFITTVTSSAFPSQSPSPSPIPSQSLWLSPAQAPALSMSPPRRPPRGGDNNLPAPNDIKGWCAMVPYPGPCKFFMGQTHHPKKKAEFRQMTVQVALNRALMAQSQTRARRKQCKSRAGRAAWNDCMILYERTIRQLSQTLKALAGSSCTDFDAQTWLSAALTNLETCGLSSSDLNATRDVLTLPHVEYNVSDLISNGLAINEGILDTDSNNTTTTTATTNSSKKFPVWVGRADRMLLLQSRRLLLDGATFVVAKDGSGDFETVQGAINAAAKMEAMARKIIYVKSGVYRENIWVNPYTNNVTLVGDGVKDTLITSARSVKGGFTTYNSATAAFDGVLLMARDITFANTAGNNAGQAVAVRSSSDLSVFYRCAFYGYQDTLFVHSQRQFYRQCYVFGTIDIVFGNAAVVFQNSRFYVRRPVAGQANVVTAQGRYDPNQNTGIVIHNCKILPAPDMEPFVGSVATYLGRPWQPYSRTVIIKSYVGGLVDSSGWLEWNNKTSYLTSLYYAEYNNFGPGSNVSGRVQWPGFHIFTSSSAVSTFSVGSFISGGSWLPSTGVPFTSGL